MVLIDGSCGYGTIYYEAQGSGTVMKLWTVRLVNESGILVGYNSWKRYQ